MLVPDYTLSQPRRPRYEYLGELLLPIRQQIRGRPVLSMPAAQQNPGLVTFAKLAPAYAQHFPRS
jgi:hypothetical protein